MADDLKNRGAQDRSRVNIHEDYEVQYWTKKWGVSKEQGDSHEANDKSNGAPPGQFLAEQAVAHDGGHQRKKG